MSDEIGIDGFLYTHPSVEITYEQSTNRILFGARNDVQRRVFFLDQIGDRFNGAIQYADGTSHSFHDMTHAQARMFLCMSCAECGIDMNN